MIQPETARIIQRSQAIINAKTLEFRKGLRPDGGRIGYYASPPYRLFKRTINPMAQGTVDLILSGRFVRGLGLELMPDKTFLFESSDEKDSKLFEKYGQENRKINESTWLDLQKKEVAPLLAKWMRQQIGQ